ncbi:MAG: RHS repeat-associated core domain-containing protein [Verrucomicrobiota bacterium]
MGSRPEWFLQGAGGVGGLLAVNDAVNGVHFSAYDGNGNVAALVKATDGTVSATYEYGPFGELLRGTGLMTKSNPFRFSTKFHDDESDQLYYGYLSYNPTTGRWPNRDPLGERGGENLYANCRNDVINSVDWLGLWKIERKGQARAMAYAEEGDTIRKLAGIIRLNKSEWKKWLKPEEVYTKPYDLDTVLTSCDSFSVPNTAYVNYNVGFVDFRLAHFMLTYTGYLRDRWSDAGYKVRYYRLLLGADTIKSQLNDPDIYTFCLHRPRCGWKLDPRE